MSKLNRKTKVSLCSTIAITALLVSSVSFMTFNAKSAFVIGADGFLIPHYFGPYPNFATSQLPIVTYATNGSIIVTTTTSTTIYNTATGTVTTTTTTTNTSTPNLVVSSVTGGIMKFIDSLPGLGPAGANNLGQYIPLAVPDTTTYNGSDYYEIAVVEYRQQMHSNLTATKLRGYVQLETSVIKGLSWPLTYLDGTPIMKPDGTPAISVDKPRYLGPFIIAQKDRPVRIKFYNLLPTGVGGDLFLPVDTTVMGAGMGPLDMPGMPGMKESYTQNRATLHLHGGRSPWISDGTAHQWTTPAGEMTQYPRGVSVYNVPDMDGGDPGSGVLTFYYTNQQSARLMFYHDHSYGITRLNVYAGEAAGYLLQDQVELGLIAAGIIPAEQIPLIIQDKTFVPDNTIPIGNMWGNFSSQLAFQDPTWDTAKWGAPGDLWYPHVYMTMQNPYDPSGMNPFGRWQYGAWFWPPANLPNGPIANPYYAGPGNPMEPLMIPGTPNPSIPGEAFLDTPVINGIAYPYLEVEPKSYRFRILNAADDRFWNLQLYIADNTTTTFDGRVNTEVKMVPAVFNATYPDYWPTDGRDGGVPDPAYVGPSFIQIGNEGGFLPAPYEIPTKPVNWNYDQGTFDFGLVNQYTLFLGTAERADVLVDFSQFAGKTLILYNDSPAPVPAADPRLDYYTGNLDQTDVGGAPSTLAGFGPNTRTLMQIRVANSTPADAFNVTALNEAFASTPTTEGVFTASQDYDIIVPQAAYNSAYNITFADLYARIFDNSLTFTPIGTNATLTVPFQAKSIQDEMGEVFDDYGRMQAMLGVELPKTRALQQTMLLYNFNEPPTELIKSSIEGTLIGSLGDGTQIWKITHNGVDTHTIHWHMFDVQLINRVAWDNNIRPTDPNELGWKETIRINPLQDTIIALRPIVPNVPFDLPNSVRLIDPTMPEGAILKVQGQIGAFDTSGQPITIVNHKVNFGWEYVWHCHILAHEEMDMMRAIAIAVPPRAPSNLVVTRSGSTATLTWKDNSLSETGFTIQRANDGNFATGLVNFNVAAGVTAYTDKNLKNNVNYYYRVFATNLVGDPTVYPAPAIGFPTLTANSEYSNVRGPPAGTTTILSVTQAAATGSPVIVQWSYTPSGDQTGFTIQRATNAAFTQGVTNFKVGGNIASFSDNTGKTAGLTYYYRTVATNSLGTGLWSNSMSIVPHA